MTTAVQAPNTPNYLVAGIISLLPMFAFVIAPWFPGYTQLLDIVLMTAVSAILFRMVPERPRISLRSMWLLLAGLGIGAVAFWIRYRHSLDTIHLSGLHSRWDIARYVFLLVVVTPLWEEKSCRNVLLFGIGKRAGVWVAALLLSAAFALPHRDNFPFAFSYSFIACALAIRGVDTWNRVLLHGGINAAHVTAWLYFGTQQ